MMNDSLLSICIPAYNNTSNLYTKVMSILSSYPYDDIEIVVSDNCSTDNANEVFSKIKDKRFCYISNNKNEGSIVNGMRVLSNGKGKYVAFLLDKDNVNCDYIYDFMNVLKKVDFAMGYCTLNNSYNKKNSYQYFKDEYSCLKKLAYLSKHPTGYIFKNSLLKKLDIQNKYSTEEQVMFFSCEFICADLSIYNSGIIINIPFFTMTKLLSNSNTNGNENGTKTFSKTKNNLYFLPKNRFKLFVKYVKHLNTLNVSNKTKQKIFIKLMFDVYKQIIINYRFMIEDNTICKHYKINKTNINFMQLIKINFDLSKNIFFSTVFNKNLINIITLSGISLIFFFLIFFYPVIKIIKYKRNI